MRRFKKGIIVTLLQNMSHRIESGIGLHQSIGHHSSAISYTWKQTEFKNLKLLKNYEFGTELLEHSVSFVYNTIGIYVA